MAKTGDKTVNNNYVALAKKYSLFQTVEHLNKTVAKHLYHKTHLLNKSAISTYKMLAKYAVKYRGTAFIKHETIAEGVGVSRRTVIRAINRLVELKIIAKKNVCREVAGGFGSNLYILLPYSDNDTANLSHRDERKEPTEKRDEPSKTETEAVMSKSSIDKYKKRFSNPYNRFQSLIFNHIPDKTLLYKVYGVFLMNIKWLRNGYDMAELTDIGIYALMESFRALKKGKVRSFTGFYNGVLRNCLNSLYSELLTE